jgi:hypothetical protein
LEKPALGRFDSSAWATASPCGPASGRLKAHVVCELERNVDRLNRKSGETAAFAAIETVDAQRAASRTIARLFASRTGSKPASR